MISVKPWRLSVGGWFAVLGGAAALVAMAALVGGLLAADRLSEARTRLVDRVDIAAVSSLRLSTALVDEETGVRGFALAGRDSFLTPLRRGRVTSDRAFAELDRLSGEERLAEFRSDVARVKAATQQWRSGYAEPAIRTVRRGGPRALERVFVAEGRQRFEAVRTALDDLERGILRERRVARSDLQGAARDLNRFLVLAAVILVLTLLVAALLVRRLVNQPLGRLTGDVRRVARGAFHEPVRGTGPRDLRALGQDVERMRRAIEAARAQLEDQAQDLQRSNAELEQFAYVASHDLQEPLRKVASFCQMLERRYGDQLDERGRQYIDFAVDGAKRMQQLINDLLAFSRVGRVGAEHDEVELADVASEAVGALDTAIEESGATVEVGNLPRVCGDPSLLALVLQNLIGNGLKFRAEEAPVVRVTSRRGSEEEWEITVHDNGIGVEEQYAERIFVIFQRLHSREAYEGTGIGLAMCRKIVEHHGGRLWLDGSADGAGDLGGATFRFTLPAIKEPVAADE